MCRGCTGAVVRREGTNTDVIVRNGSNEAGKGKTKLLK